MDWDCDGGLEFETMLKTKLAAARGFKIRHDDAQIREASSRMGFVGPRIDSSLKVSGEFVY